MVAKTDIEQVSKKFRDEFIKNIVYILLAVVVALVAFYYNTINTLANNSKDIEELKRGKANVEDVSKIQNDIKIIIHQQDKIYDYLLNKK